jgi:DnaJ family protein A protein 2
LIEKEVKLPVALQKGAPHGSSVILNDEGDEMVLLWITQPEAQPGDVHVMFVVKPHDTFTVEKANLHIKRKISLTEALTGYCFSLTHLDGKSYRVQTHPGEVLQDKSKRVLKKLGLPHFKK